MLLPDTILLVSALVLLFGGFATGVAISRVRAIEPTSPRYLSFAHQGAIAEAPLLFAKDVVNWRTGVEDEFRDGGVGYRMATGFGPLHLAGLVMLAVAIGAGL